MSWQKEALFTVAPFSMKSVVMGLFMSQKIVGMTFFTDHFFINFFFTRVRVFPLNGLSFWLGLASLWKINF